MPTTALVRKGASLLGRDLGEERAARVGMATHYGFGAAGGPVVVLLASRGADPVRPSLTVAAAMELGADQGVNAVLGLMAPTWLFPWQAQAWGVAAHVVYGLALGLLLTAGRKR